MNKKSFVVVPLVILMLACSVVVVSANKGWEEFSDDGTNHPAHWTGELIRASKGVELWFLTTRVADEEAGYATMLIVWHPKTQEGSIHCFTHYGYMMYFTNWRGTIKFDVDLGEYCFAIRGPGRGSIDADYTDVWYDGEVWGYFDGIWTPVDSENPMQEGNSIADWAATIRYHR